MSSRTDRDRAVTPARALVLGTALRASVAATVALLAVSVVGAAALVAVLPTRVPFALAGRLPLLLMSAALSGRWQVDGELAGRVSALNDGGLLGAPRGVSDGSGHLVVTAMPASLTAVACVVLALVVRRDSRRAQATSSQWVGSVCAVAVAFGVLTTLLALAARVALAGGSVSASVPGTALGAAVVGLLGAAVGGFGQVERLWPRTHRLLAAPLAQLGWIGAGLGVVGIPVAVFALLLDRNGSVGGLIGILAVGQPLSPGLVVVLVALAAPVIVWSAMAVLLGVPLDVAGGALHFGASRVITLASIARSHPALSFGPVLVALLLVALAAWGAHRGPAKTPGDPTSGDGWLGRVGGQVALLAAVGIVLRAACTLTMSRVVPAAPTESGSAILSFWASVAMPAAFGALFALVVPLMPRRRRRSGETAMR